MLREEVLREWGSCKEKLTKLNKDIEFLDNQTVFDSALPRFPLDFDSMRRNLDFWNSSNFGARIYENEQKVLGVKNEKLSWWVSSYLDKISMFKSLTMGWKREMDSNNFGSGPTIEEVY